MLAKRVITDNQSQLSHGNQAKSYLTLDEDHANQRKRTCDICCEGDQCPVRYSIIAFTAEYLETAKTAGSKHFGADRRRKEATPYKSANPQRNPLVAPS